MKIVLDTNIYIAAALNESGLSRDIIEITTQISSITIITSDPILDELRNKLKVKFHWEEHRINFYIDNIKKITDIVSVKEKLTVVRDPKDNKILECALAGEADLIVTMDQDLIKLKNFRGVAIIHPKTFTWTFPDYFKKKDQ